MAWLASLWWAQDSSNTDAATNPSRPRQKASQNVSHVPGLRMRSEKKSSGCSNMTENHKPLLKTSHKSVKPGTPAKAAGGLIAAIEVHIAATAAHPGPDGIRPSGRTPLFQPRPLQPPKAESLPAETLDLFINTPPLTGCCFPWPWMRQQDQNQRESSSTDSDEHLRQSIRAEVEQELRAEYEHKQMETEEDCVAWIVAVEMSCTNKIIELAQRHHVGLERMKLLVKAKGTHFKQVMQQHARDAYKAGFAAGLAQAAAEHESQPEQPNTNTDGAAVSPADKAGTRDQQQDPASIPLPVSLLSKINAAAAGTVTAPESSEGTVSGIPPCQQQPSSSDSEQQGASWDAVTVQRLAGVGSSSDLQQFASLGSIWGPDHVAVAAAWQVVGGSPGEKRRPGPAALTEVGSWQQGGFGTKNTSGGVVEAGAATAAALAALG